jgi:hypothetical protein
MEEKQNTNVMAADLDNVLQEICLSQWTPKSGQQTNTKKTHTHQQARKKFVAKINLKTSRYI